MEEVLQSIPKDIIIQFLLRLPVKTLLRFKSVCKQWYHLIKSDIFISMHHTFDNVSHLLIISNIGRPPQGYDHVFSFRSNNESVSVSSPDLEIPPYCDDVIVRVVGSFNGIVCFYGCCSRIVLCNPALREFKQLPPTSSFPLGVLPHLQHGIGFGFDSSNIYDFKVVRIFYEDTHDKEFRAEMFTLSSNTWRQLHWGLSNNLLLLSMRTGLFCSNSFNFIMHDLDARENVIVCCDICTERFKMMELPPKQEARKVSFPLLMVFKGCLSLIYTLGQYDENAIEIWVMQDYGVVESWTKLYSIRPPSHAWPLCFWMNDHDLLLLEETKTEKLVSCHLSTLNIEHIENFGDQVFSQDKIVVYKETLISICDISLEHCSYKVST